MNNEGLYIDVLVSLDLVLLQHVQILLRQMSAVLMVIDAFYSLTFLQLVTDESGFHGVNPLFMDVFIPCADGSHTCRFFLFHVKGRLRKRSPWIQLSPASLGLGLEVD